MTIDPDKETEWTTLEAQDIGPRVREKNLHTSGCLRIHHFVRRRCHTVIEAIVERCAGLDVHQESVVVCVLTGPLDRSPRSEIRTFGTMMEDLQALTDWLNESECTHVAMESTGVYFKPVWNVLEVFDFELLLANAHHIKNLPGRKTDMDCQTPSLWYNRRQLCPRPRNARLASSDSLPEEAGAGRHVREKTHS